MRSSPPRTRWWPCLRAPLVQSGNTVRVRFNQLGSSVSQTTNAIPCSPTNSANFYIAGMYPNTEYQMHHETVSSSGMIVQTGTTYTFTTGPIPAGITFPQTTVVTPASPPSSVTAPILLHDYILGSKPAATDLSGNVLWYYARAVGELTRTEPGGRMFGINSPKNQCCTTPPCWKSTWPGNITLQTNAHRINEQLALLTGPNGKPRRPITQFDHEALRLPNGNIVVKAVKRNAGDQCRSMWNHHGHAEHLRCPRHGSAGT